MSSLTWKQRNHRLSLLKIANTYGIVFGSYHVPFRINESKSSTVIRAKVLRGLPVPCYSGNKVTFPLVYNPII